ncbi:hypothetical protein J2Z48_002509 [Croceifilum oryzae]|uniref:DUF5689 domain-containing protein n=1 Tax=Croceifilum oryzae TaxID=1553429 RepID=A0AAJ1WR98_9BACL|nr:hypothetical protein [Croceifilum oryzae]MDQ0418317.1 hypothetical protein [Croceifilum oryzae]
MRKMFFLCMIGVLLMGTGCNAAIEAQQAKRTEILKASIEKTTTTNSIIRTALGIGEVYPSVESLSKESSIIIQGVVTSRSTFQSEGVTFVKSTVKITNSLSGKVVAGNTITFVTLLGFSTMKATEKVILFGRYHPKDLLFSQDIYTIVGGFQGEFHIKGNRAKRITEHLSKTDQKTFPPLEMKRSLLTKKIKKAKP